jgi:hypothetical protein
MSRGYIARLKEGEPTVLIGVITVLTIFSRTHFDPQDKLRRAYTSETVAFIYRTTRSTTTAMKTSYRYMNDYT